MRKIVSLLIATLAFQISHCQTDSPTLLTIDGHKISKAEFIRIYKKNSNIATEQKKSVDDYLNLFINYKLKVIEAENLGYDTASSFIKEMAGYRDQLAKPYLTDTTLVDSLTKVYYKWSKYEVNVSHIMVKVSMNAPPADTLKAYKKIMAIKDSIDHGMPFEKAAEDNSDDPGSRKNDGKLGWFSVFRMVYPFEVAAFSTPVGHVTGPIRTIYGYHLLKVNGKRVKSGPLDVSHIMVIVPQHANSAQIKAAKEKIDKAYAALQKGMPWDDVVKEYSEHKASIKHGGHLGWVTPENSSENFYENCIKVKNGEYSKPFRTIYGFHIVKVSKRRPLPTFKQAKSSIRKHLEETPDVQALGEARVLKRIENEYGYTFNDKKLQPIYKRLDNSIYKGKWNADTAKDLTSPLLKIGDKTYTQYDFAKYLATQRFLVTNNTKESNFARCLKNFKQKCVLDYAKAHLGEKYPEYKNLMQEYHDGILLFNLTEDVVWKKAVKDSAGLQKFYDQTDKKYKWKPRVQLSEYAYSDSTLTPKLLKLAKKQIKKESTAKELSAELCPKDSIPCIRSIKKQAYEKGENAIGDSITWKKGAYLVTKTKGHFVLYYVDDLLPVQVKKLNEARGLYTADYQTYLEKQWVNKLRKKYTIHVNQDVLEQIKKELGKAN